MAAISASHRHAADTVSVSSTVCRSKEDRLITFSTSAVATCCCKDSESSSLRACTSSNSRTFSSAMAAWWAKLVDERDLCLGERRDDAAQQAERADRDPVADERYAEHASEAADALELGKG